MYVIICSHYGIISIFLTLIINIFIGYFSIEDDKSLWTNELKNLIQDFYEFVIMVIKKYQ